MHKIKLISVIQFAGSGSECYASNKYGEKSKCLVVSTVPMPHNGLPETSLSNSFSLKMMLSMQLTCNDHPVKY